MTIHDILRAVIRSDRALLNDAAWVEQALAAIDAADSASAPKKETT